MPQKQKKYEDAMSSVFDFVFEQTQKPPSKVKPVKMTGVDTSNEVMEAISATLESPLIFVNQSMVDAFEEVTDMNLLRIKLGSRQTDKVDINLRTARDFLKDPNKFVDKAFATMDAKRKMQRVNIWGEEMRGVVAGVWANKRGLDAGAQAAMLGIGRNIKNSYIESETSAVVERSRQILEGNFGPKGSPTRGFISTKIPRKTVEAMLPHLKGDTDAIEAIQKQYEDLVKGHITGKDKKYEDRLRNPDLYTLLEGKDLLHKAYTAPTNDQKYGYMAAARYVANSNQLGSLKSKDWAPKMRNFIDQSKDKKKDYQSKIKALRGTPGSSAQIDAYKKAIKQIDEDITFAKRMDFGEKIGDIEGGWYTIKDFVVDGNLLPSLINGNFFDPRRNAIKWLQPSKLSDVLIGHEMVKDKATGKLKKVGITVETHLAKDGRNPFLNKYSEAMNEVYYLSPATWVRSLMTGEIFSYRLSKVRKKFEKKMGKLFSGFELEGSVLSGIYENHSDILKFMSGGLSPSEMKKIYSALPPEIQAILKNKKARAMFKKFVKDNKLLGDLTRVFSVIERTKNKIQDLLNEKVWSKLRDLLGRELLKRMTNEAAKSLIKTWVAKGGIKTLIKGLVTSVLTGIGVVTTGGGGFLIGAVTWVVTEVVYRVSKPLLKLIGQLAKLYVQLVGFGILGLFGVVLLFGSFFVLIFGKHSHIAPNQVVMSANWEAMGWEPVDYEGGGSSGSFDSQFVPGNLPAGQQCLFQSGPVLRCTQGPYASCDQPGYLQPSHSNSPAIDVAVGGGFHAPQFCDTAKGNCKIVAVGNGTCGGGKYDAGGYVMFTADYEGRTYEFYVLHVDYDTSFTSGQVLGPGQKVAEIVHKDAWMNCSTGLHAHVSVKINGSFVNPEPLFNQDFQCQLSSCPVKDVCYIRK